MARLPRRWGLPIDQVGMAASCSCCSGSCSRPTATWVSVAFYVAGLILGVLLISQFWTLANVIYDPRQAKRLFGFIGGGAPARRHRRLGAGRRTRQQIGSTNLLLPSAALMVLCAALVALIIGRERV